MRAKRETGPARPWRRAGVQLYTGDGKGKTTAAFGLALRAAGHGLEVFVGQFMKRYPYGELAAAAALESVVIEQFGTEECLPLVDEPAAEDVRLAEGGLDRCRAAMLSGDFAVVILDEVCVAVRFGLLSEAELLAFIDRRPAGVELVLTGRWATPETIARADLVTEMRELRHPFASGWEARDGIER